jgi:hypothetical protein
LTQGTAETVSLNGASISGNNGDNNPVTVVFNFTPDNPSDATGIDRVLTVGDGKHPPLDYVLSKGLTVGSTHPCTRQIIASGTCPPVIYTFTYVDLSDYAASCF